MIARDSRIRAGRTEVLIAVPSASGAQMRRFVEICNRAKDQLAPSSLEDIIAGQIALATSGG